MPSGALSASAELAEVKNSDKGHGLWDYPFIAVDQEAEKRVRLLRTALSDLFPGLLSAAEKIQVGDADTGAEELAVPEERGENLPASEARELLGFEDYDGLVGELIPDDLVSVLVPSRYVDRVRGFVDDLVDKTQSWTSGLSEGVVCRLATASWQPSYFGNVWFVVGNRERKGDRS